MIKTIFFLSLLAVTTHSPVRAGQIIYEYADEETAVEALERPDLSRDGLASERAGIPIVVLFSSSWCEYCRLLKEEVLLPMTRNEEYSRKVILREVDVQGSQKLAGFQFEQGNQTFLLEYELAKKLNISLVPTLVYLDSKGNEILKRQTGVSNIEFYGYYLDEDIKKAHRKLSEER